MTLTIFSLHVGMGSLIRWDVNAAAGQEVGLGVAQPVVLIGIKHHWTGPSPTPELHPHELEWCRKTADVGHLQIWTAHPLHIVCADIFMWEHCKSPQYGSHFSPMKKNFETGFIKCFFSPPNTAPLSFPSALPCQLSYSSSVLTQVCSPVNFPSDGVQ